MTKKINKVELEELKNVSGGLAISNIKFEIKIKDLEKPLAINALGPCKKTATVHDKVRDYLVNPF